MHCQSNDYLLVFFCWLRPQYRSELCECVFPVCQVLYEIMWITKIEFNVYETNLDCIINACVGCHYLVCPLNVAHVMAFSKCDYFRFIIFLADEAVSEILSFP